MSKASRGEPGGRRRPSRDALIETAAGNLYDDWVAGKWLKWFEQAWNEYQSTTPNTAIAPDG